MRLKTRLFSRYLPVDTQARDWGWHLIDAGQQQTDAGAPYPLPGHPLAYYFEEDGRRILDEFQIVLVVNGHGHFESRSQPRTSVRAGDAFILFPEEWHRYGPAPEASWHEYWVGFEGKAASELMQAFFNTTKPVFHNAPSTELIRLFGQQLDWIRNPQPGGDQVAASLIPQQLALLRCSRLVQASPGKVASQIIIHAKASILSDLQGRTDFEAMAGELGLSYTRFRKLFRSQTGYAPREFENLIKLNRARDLLRTGGSSVTATADALGYQSVHYFSRAFKKQFGFPPTQSIPHG